MSDERIEPDLARASTPPAAWYRGEEQLARERERVFGRTWQLAARASDLAEPGQFVAAEVAGEPLVLARGEDGVLRAFSAVCRHRAGCVASGAGRRKAFQCAYHGWSYGLDGRLLAAPEFEGVLDFDPRRFSLPAFQVAGWGPFVFVNLDPQAPALEQFLAPVPAQTAHLPLDRLRLYRAHDYAVACNWKVYVDNYLEGYHIPIVHPGLFRLLDYRAYRVETGRFVSKQHAPLRPQEAQSLYHRNLPEGAAPEALYCWAFPNLMLNLYPDNLQVNLILPDGPRRTITRFEWYVLDPGRPGWEQEFEASFAFSDEVQAEDIAVCEAVQRGLESRSYDRGRYSVRRENGLFHFHALLHEFLARP